MSHFRAIACRIVLSVLASLLPPSVASAQIENPPKLPKLKLEITPSKRTYTVAEAVLLRYKLTSLTDGTVCFPAPVIDPVRMNSGWLDTIATKAGSSEQGERFLESFWEGHSSEEQFRTAVMQRWVKLGMSEPYRPRGSGAVVALKSPGKWVLRSTYHPPVLTDAEKSIVESLGCSPPDTLVQSDSVIITVVDPSQ